MFVKYVIYKVRLRVGAFQAQEQSHDGEKIYRAEAALGGSLREVLVKFKIYSFPRGPPSLDEFYLHHTCGFHANVQPILDMFMTPHYSWMVLPAAPMNLKDFSQSHSLEARPVKARKGTRGAGLSAEDLRAVCHQSLGLTQKQGREGGSNVGRCSELRVSCS